MRVQEPCAGPAAADHHQLQRCFVAWQNKAQTCSWGCSAENGKDVFVVLWADAT
jgi:hypothetical protein